MVAPRREAPARRSPAEPEVRSSAELLLDLATRNPVAELLGTQGIGPGELLNRSRDLPEVLGPEPADWRLRLAARGGGGGDLPLLLAISRSADSHAYQLLEQLGVSCSALRRQIIEQMRAEGEARLRGQTSTPRPRVVHAGRARSATPSPERGSPPRPGRASRPSVRASVRSSARGHASAPSTPQISRPIRATSVGSSPGPAASPERESERSSAAASRSEAGPTLTAIDPARLPPLHGRQRDLARIADALGRKRARVPLLVGSSGSGRTLVASYLSTVLEQPIYRLDATAYEDEEALADDLATVHDAGGIAIFDDLDRVPTESAPAFLGALGHAWSVGKPRILTIVSPDSHARLGTWLPAAIHGLDVLHLEPLQGSDLQAAVRAGAPSIVAEHGVELGSDVKLGEVTRLADRYLTGLAMPARALDLLDLACARTRRAGHPTLQRSTLVEIVSERSGLPENRIEARADQEALDLEARLGRRVVGHEEAVATIARLIRRNRAGFGGSRPVLCALLLGPSGVGKTELAKALCAALYEREDALVRLDMSEYSESHAVARIVGAPPGYVGHEQGGALTDPLLARPHAVVLLDEIEKAHRDVHQLLLQVFDDGRLTDGRGRTVDFRHAAIIMTSNLGSDRFCMRGGGEPQMEESEVLQAARSAFPVELWNRIEAPLVMHPLTRDQLSRICRRLARTSSDRLFRERGIRYALSDRTCAHLVALASRDPALGARPLRHLLVRDVESAIADAILRGRLRAGNQVEVDLQGSRIVLR